MNNIEENKIKLEGKEEIDFEKENKDFIEKQKEAQKQLHECINNRPSLGVITIIGENGSGKTNYAALTSPYHRTLYLNFESVASAKTVIKLSEEKLIGYMECTPNECLAKFLKKIQEICEKNQSRIKVLIIDSIGELVRRSIEQGLIGDYRENIKQYNWDTGSHCNAQVIPYLDKFYYDMQKLGITIIQLCGVNLPNEKGSMNEENFQIQTDIMRKRIKPRSNAVYMIENFSPEGRYSLLKDNIGLKPQLWSKFFLSRKLIINEFGETLKQFEYKQKHFKAGEIVSYGIINYFKYTI